jgi:hypothetical protein
MACLYKRPSAAEPQPKKIGRKERKEHKRDVGATGWSPFGSAIQKILRKPRKF